MKCSPSLPLTLSDKMTDNQTPYVRSWIQAGRYGYSLIKNNDYFFTFESRAYPEEEEFGHLGFIQPYFTEVNPNCPLGRPEDHNEDPRTLLPIPKLLGANSLDEDQYPWNILCSGVSSVALKWECKRCSLYQELNAEAYKYQRSTIAPRAPEHSPPPRQSEMSTVTGNALQTSYP